MPSASLALYFVLNLVVPLSEATLAPRIEGFQAGLGCSRVRPPGVDTVWQSKDGSVGTELLFVR